jgi:hypothetical protein
MAHHSKISITNVDQDPQASRELAQDLEWARHNGIGAVSLTSGSRPTPALIKLRSVVTNQPSKHGRVKDNWSITISPAESSSLLTRLLARPSDHDVSAVDAPTPGFVQPEYSIVQALEEAHLALSGLEPPRIGTSVEITFGITQTMQRLITFHASSVDALRIARGIAKQENALAQQKWEAAHFPATGPVYIFDRQIWPWWNIALPNLVHEPTIPRNDPWQSGGSLYTQIADIVLEHFVMRRVNEVWIEDGLMSSLWKATFKHDKPVAAQLTTQGYDLNRIGATRMGMDPLRELMASQRQQAHRTMMPTPDLMKELGVNDIRSLTRHNAGPVYQLEINEED